MNHPKKALILDDNPPFRSKFSPNSNETDPIKLFYPKILEVLKQCGFGTNGTGLATVAQVTSEADIALEEEKFDIAFVNLWLMGSTTPNSRSLTSRTHFASDPNQGLHWARYAKQQGWLGDTKIVFNTQRTIRTAADNITADFDFSDSILLRKYQDPRAQVRQLLEELSLAE